MPEATKYNGWSNRETWLANLWLNNEEPSYRVFAQALRMDADTSERAEWLEEQLRLQLDCEIDTPCLWQDLLRTSFGRISWLEVIEKNLD